MPENGHIQLEPAEYWELRARMRDVETAALDLQAERAELMERHKLRAETLNQARRVCFDRLSGKYGFDPTLTYRWDDATFELIKVT